MGYKKSYLFISTGNVSPQVSKQPSICVHKSLHVGRGCRYSLRKSPPHWVYFSPSTEPTQPTPSWQYLLHGIHDQWGQWMTLPTSFVMENVQQIQLRLKTHGPRLATWHEAIGVIRPPKRLKPRNLFHVVPCDWSTLWSPPTATGDPFSPIQERVRETGSTH